MAGAREVLGVTAVVGTVPAVVGTVAAVVGTVACAPLAGGAAGCVVVGAVGDGGTRLDGGSASVVGGWAGGLVAVRACLVAGLTPGSTKWARGGGPVVVVAEGAVVGPVRPGLVVVLPGERVEVVGDVVVVVWGRYPWESRSARCREGESMYSTGGMAEGSGGGKAEYEVCARAKEATSCQIWVG